jgi:hypothetical protein
VDSSVLCAVGLMPYLKPRYGALAGDARTCARSANAANADLGEDEGRTTEGSCDAAGLIATLQEREKLGK